jgi:hypothetical protein
VLLASAEPIKSNALSFGARKAELERPSMQRETMKIRISMIEMIAMN